MQRPLWADPLTSQGDPALRKPTLSAPCTTPIKAPCSRSQFPDLPPFSHYWGQPSNSHLGMVICCPGLMLSTPQRHSSSELLSEELHKWMINDRNLTTLTLPSTYLCLITSLTEVLRIMRLEKTLMIISSIKNWGNWGSETLADFPEAILC